MYNTGVVEIINTTKQTSSWFKYIIKAHLSNDVNYRFPEEFSS